MLLRRIACFTTIYSTRSALLLSLFFHLSWSIKLLLYKTTRITCLETLSSSLFTCYGIPWRLQMISTQSFCEKHIIFRMSPPMWIIALSRSRLSRANATSLHSVFRFISRNIHFSPSLPRFLPYRGGLFGKFNQASRTSRCSADRQTRIREKVDGANRRAITAYLSFTRRSAHASVSSYIQLESITWHCRPTRLSITADCLINQLAMGGSSCKLIRLGSVKTQFGRWRKSPGKCAQIRVFSRVIPELNNIRRAWRCSYVACISPWPRPHRRNCGERTDNFIARRGPTEAVKSYLRSAPALWSGGTRGSRYKREYYAID